MQRRRWGGHPASLVAVTCHEKTQEHHCGIREKWFDKERDNTTDLVSVMEGTITSSSSPSPSVTSSTNIFDLEPATHREKYFSKHFKTSTHTLSVVRETDQQVRWRQWCRVWQRRRRMSAVAGPARQLGVASLSRHAR